MTWRGRVQRLERATRELTLRRRATTLAAERGQSPDEVLADLRRFGAWRAQDRARYPQPVRSDGKVDIEPQLRRMALAFGRDPDAAVQEAKLLLAHWKRR